MEPHIQTGLAVIIAAVAVTKLAFVLRVTQSSRRRQKTARLIVAFLALIMVSAEVVTAGFLWLYPTQP